MIEIDEIGRLHSSVRVSQVLPVRASAENLFLEGKGQSDFGLDAPFAALTRGADDPSGSR